MARPSFGRPKRERHLNQFDTPPIALDPLFAHEPLLRGVTTICEPFCGKGNLVIPMRARGLRVFASDIEYRGCPDSAVLDFRAMTARPPDCDVLVSNPAYDGIAGGAMEFIEHALALRFGLIVLLLKTTFLHSEERYERLHPRGVLRRVHVLAERLQDMHDARHIAAGGKKAGQSQEHGWFVFDREYRGKPEINVVSIKRPDLRMPWERRDNGKIRYHGPRGTSRAYVLARLAREGRTDLAERIAAGSLSVRAVLRQLRDGASNT
jgi:hypothetical protein